MNHQITIPYRHPQSGRSGRLIVTVQNDTEDGALPALDDLAGELAHLPEGGLGTHDVRQAVATVKLTKGGRA